MSRDDDIDLWDVLYRHRLTCGPLYVATGAAATAGLSAMLDTGQTAVGLAGVAIAGAALIKTQVRDKLRRIYSYAVLGASTSWVMTAHEIMPEHLGWTGVSLGAATAVLGIPWWTSNVRRSQVRMETTLREWPTVARRIGLGEAGMVDVTMTSTGYRGKFLWPKGQYEVESVQSMRGRIEGAMGASVGTLQMEPDGKSTNSIRFQVVERDPHAAPQNWPLPTRIGKAADPVEIGIRADGEVVKIQRFAPGKGCRHSLIAGQTESGKSSLINLATAQSVCTDDKFVIGLDFKKVELTPWKPALGYMTSEVSKAEALIRAFCAPGGALDERAKKLAARGARVWDTAIDGPVVTFVIDEARNLLGSANAILINMAIRLFTEGRALGIEMIIATQYPTLEAIGSSQIRQQIKHRYAFRMQDLDGEGFVMPGYRVNAHKISSDRAGTCYVLDGDKLEPRPIRVWYLDDETVKAIALARMGETVELDPETENVIVALFPEFADRERYVSLAEQERENERDGDENGERDSENERDSEGNTEGNSARDSGNAEGDGSENEGEPQVPAVPAWDGTDSGTDVHLSDMIARYRESLTPQEREISDRKREEELATRPGGRLNEDEAREALMAALVAAGAGGERARNLQAAADRSSSWFYALAHKWAKEGTVVRTKFATWALVSEVEKAKARGVSTTTLDEHSV